MDPRMAILDTPINAHGELQIANCNENSAPQSAINHLQSSIPQVLYLDLAGAANVDYRGPITVTGIDVPAFALPQSLAGHESIAAASLRDQVQSALAGLGVTVTTERPSAGDYSTIYVGGDGESFQQYGFHLGLAEKVDHDNADPSDNAFVFSSLIAPNAATLDYVRQVAEVVTHEAKHLLGYEHSHHDDSGDPLGDVAFKVQTHVEIARDVRDDLLQDGKLTIDGRIYEVHPKILEAIRNYPAFYYGGTVGADGFPDIAFGQGILHPLDSGIWMARVLDMAWAAQSSATYSDAEKQQILAWAYGYLTHGAGDVWAHTLMNDFAEGVFPSIASLPTNARNFGNAVRHVLIEGYIGDATPGIDGNPDRTLLSDGDISSTSSVGEFIDAPAQFVFETFIKHFTGEPTTGRGPFLDEIFELQAKVNEQALLAGPRPAEDFHVLIRDVAAQIAAGQTPSIATLDIVYRAYLYNWLDDIDTGLHHWSDFGLGVIKGLVDAQSKRDLQNREGQRFGADIEAQRADGEEVSLLDAITNELSDPNNDQNFDDSFINNHLLPMYGVPTEFTQFRSVLQTFGARLGREITGPIQTALNPITEQLEKINEFVKDKIEEQIKARFGLDLKQLEFLENLGAKMDVASIVADDGTDVPMFKPDAHAKIDEIMGIEGSSQSEALDARLTERGGLTLYEGAVGTLDGNVEFDKTKFAAYANSVTLAKLLLLSERPVDGATIGAGALSKFFSDQLGRPYDFSLLNLNGGHGGNIMTATLPKPGQTADIIRDTQRAGQAPSDARPGLYSFDTDHAWRTDSQTRLTENFRFLPAGPGKATWTVTGLAPGRYKVQAAWLINLAVNATSEATYRIFDGNTQIGTPVSIDQLQFASEIPDGGIFFDELGVFQINSGTLRLELAGKTDGDVVAGPMRLERADGTGTPIVVRNLRDANGNVVSQTPGYAETGEWNNLTYLTGAGNFPLWESDMLRPIFRHLFRDFQNGDENFPDLGDPTSPDPNENASIHANPMAPMVSVFETRTAQTFPAGQDFIVNGNLVLTLTGDVVLGSVVGNGDATFDSFTLNTTGKVVVTENIGGGGLGNIAINAAGGIEVAPGVTITSRQFAGSESLGGASTGNSGNITLTSRDIEIDNGARLLAHATNGFTAGMITLNAAQAINFTFVLGIQSFQVAQANANIGIGGDAILKGATITITTSATTSKSATLTQNLAPGSENELAQLVDLVGPPDLSGLSLPFDAAAVFSDATSTIHVGAGALLAADNRVQLDAQADSQAVVTTSGRYLGATVGSSNPTAIVTISNGAKLTSTGSVDVSAKALNTLNVTTIVPQSGEANNVSIAYGKTDSVSKVTVEPGAIVQAQTASFKAENNNAISNRALAAGFSQAQAGVGATVVIGSYFSDASVNVAGTITTSGNLLLDAKSINTQDQSRAFAAVVNPVGDNPVLREIRDFLATVDLSQEIDGQNIDPTKAPSLSVAGAVVIVDTSNKAAALFDDGADVKVGGTIDVNSQAIDPFQASATSSASDASNAGIGGAIAFSKVSNQATSFIGPNTLVDANQTIHLTANATISNPGSAFDPTLTLNDVDTAAGNARIADEYNDGVATGAALKQALAGLASYLTGAKQNATTAIHAGGTVNPQGKVGIAGGVNFLDIYNAGVTGIAGGAKVNQRVTQPSLFQDVQLDGNATIETIDIAGVNSDLNFRASQLNPITAGGNFDGVFLDNHAKAAIDDRAIVSAARDVNLRSTSLNQVTAVGEAGGAAGDVGVDGSFAFVKLTTESLAGVEDRATVHAQRNLNVNADNNTLAVNVNGGVAQGRVVGVGVSASFINVDSTTQAYLGNQAHPMGELGTGGILGEVTAGNDIILNAHSNHEVWSISVSGAESPGTPVLGKRGGVQQANGLQFGFGVSGDVAFNNLTDDTEAYIRDFPSPTSVRATGDIALDASATTQMQVAAGAIAFGNHVGLGGSFAQNSAAHQTVATTQDANLQAASLSMNAATADTFINVSNGGSGAADASVAGSVNVEKTDNVTQAALGARSQADITGAVDIQAGDTTTVHSVAGASSASNDAFLAIGAAVDLGFINKKAQAFVGDNSALTAGGIVNIHSTTHDNIESVAAAQATSKGVGEPSRLYKNGGATPFTSATAAKNVTDPDQRVTSMALGDLDRDGDLDLITGNFAQFNRVYRNIGGAFDVGANIGLAFDTLLNENAHPNLDSITSAVVPDLTMAIALADLDGDGSLDVIAGNFGQPNRVYFNDGRGRFGPGFAVGGNADLTRAIAVGDFNGDKHPDIVAGNLNAPVRVYLNDGHGNFGAGLDLTNVSSLTTSVAVGDVNGDGKDDIVAGNVDLDLKTLIDQGLLKAQDFVDKAVVKASDLAQNGVATLVDLVQRKFLDQFDFDAFSDVTVAQILNSGLVRLEDLVRAGLLALDNFTNVPISLNALVNSGIVTASELTQAAIVDQFGNVKLKDLVSSGLVFLEEVLGANLVPASAVNVVNFKLGDVLSEGLVTLEELLDKKIIDAADLIRDQLDLRKLLDSGLVQLKDLINKKLLASSDLDLSKLPVDTLQAALTGNAPTTLFLGVGDGTFKAGAAVSSDRAATMSVALGDIDGDKDLDLVVGNAGSASRLYKNDGKGKFSNGISVTPADQTQQVVLADVNGDSKLDLLTANLGAANKVFLNNGAGGFRAGTNIGTQTDFTSSLAVGEVDRDGRRDVIAGNNRPSIGAAGSVSVWQLDHTAAATVNDGASITTDQSLLITAADRADVAAITGAAASGLQTGVGLSAGSTNIKRNVVASIGDADILARGPANAGLPFATGIIVSAASEDNLLGYAAGQGNARQVGAAASATVNNIDSHTTATIGDGAAVNLENNGSSAFQDVIVRATHTTTVQNIDGAFAGATVTGIGVALDAEILNKDVIASIAPTAVVKARDDVQVSAASVDVLNSNVVGTANASTSLSLAGSVSLMRPTVSTQALIAGNVDSEGNVVVTADSDVAVVAKDGAAVGGGSGGAGVSIAAILHDNTVKADLAKTARVTARSLRGTTAVPTGEETASGDAILRNIQGVWVGATSRQTMLPLVAGAANGATVSAAGSLVFTVLNETTQAFIDPGAVVNVFKNDDIIFSIDQDVQVLAFSLTTLLGQAGALPNRDLVGIGAGVDFLSLTKTTEAKLGGHIQAQRDIQAQAISREDLASITSTKGLSLSTAIGGTASLFTLDINTHADVSAEAQIRAVGSINVAADDTTEIDLIDGNKQAGIGAVGASIGAVVLTKDTVASIGEKADVTALGARTGIGYNAGDFAVSFVPDAGGVGEVTVPSILNGLLQILTVAFDLHPLRKAAHDAVKAFTTEAAGQVASDALDILKVSAPSPDPKFSQKRVATPRTSTNSGLTVTATSRDDIETLAVGLGAAVNVQLPQVSAGAVVVNNHTAAFVAKDAVINRNLSGAGSAQSVVIAAGSDTHLMSIAGQAGATGVLTVGPTVTFASINNLTEAFIDSNASVQAGNSVQVYANGTEDVLLVTGGASAAVGINLAGSFPVLSLNTRTHAFINDGAGVSAGGNVQVLATDRTDSDIIGGSATLVAGGSFGASAGVTLIHKDTVARIGKGATVNARALPAVTLGGIKANAGIDVQAKSSENVFGVMFSAGGSLLGGLTASLNFALVDSDTRAAIEPDALINTKTPGATTAQSVHVEATNDAKVFGVVGSFVAGFQGLSGAADVGLIRNDTEAIIDEGATVRATGDVVVAALSTKNINSFVSGIGATSVFGLSIYSMRADFSVGFLKFLNIKSASSVQDYLDGQVAAFTKDASTSISKLLGNLKSVIGKPATKAADTIKSDAPESAVSKAIKSPELDSGNKASINAADVHADGNVLVSAEEKLKSVLETAYVVNFGASSPLLNVVSNAGLLQSAGNAVATIEGDAKVFAGGDLGVNAHVEDNSLVDATNVFNNTGSTTNAFIEDATVEAKGDVSVSANADAIASFSGLIPGFTGTKTNDTHNTIRNTIDAHISGVSATCDNVTVTATDHAVMSVTADAVSLFNVAFDKVAIGVAFVSNDVSNSVSAYVENSDVTATIGDVAVHAESSPELTVVAVGGAAFAAAPFAAAASDGHNVIANTIAAHISQDSKVVAHRTARVDADDKSKIVTATGGIAQSFADAAAGAALSRNDVNNFVSAIIKKATVTAAAVDVRTGSTANVKGIALGLKEANTFAGGGSVVRNNVGDSLDAHVKGATLNVSGNVFVHSTDDPTILAVSGTGAFSGEVAIGAAFSQNAVSNGAHAFIEKSSLTATGNVDVNASDLADIQAVTVSGAGAGTVGGAASIAQNTILTAVDARIGDGADVHAKGAVRVFAQDQSSIGSVAATAAGSGIAAGDGAIGTNDIGGPINATIEGADITASGTVELTALSSMEIHDLAAGVGGSGSFSLTGGVSLNNLHGVIGARVKPSSHVTAIDNILISATDECTIEALAGQAGGAIAGLGAAAAYNEIAHEVKATAESATLTSSSGSILVTGKESATINNIAIGGSFGVAGITGSVSVNLIANDLTASLTGASVTADGSVVVLADTDGSVTALAGAVGDGIVGVGGSVVVNTVENKTKALVSDSTVVTRHNTTGVTVPRWLSTGAEFGQTIKGLAVIATANEDVKVTTAAGSSGGAGIAGDVTVTRVSDTTTANLSGATVNSAADFGESVKVRAHQETDVNLFGGALSFGLIHTAGASVNTTLISNTTRAAIDNLPTKFSPAAHPSNIHAKSVEVSTNTLEDVDAVVAGGSRAGFVALDGSVSVIDIRDTNEAVILRSDVFSLGDLQVNSRNNASINAKVGVVGNATVGAAGSVSVNTIANSTKAQVLSANLNAVEATGVTAHSNEKITTFTGTGVLGLGLGAAGAVSVNTIESATDALVGADLPDPTDRNGKAGPPSSINQDSDFQRETQPRDDQTVSIQATDAASIDGQAGAFGASIIGGIGASVDVGAIRNRTVAVVGAGTKINAAGNVDILATATHDMDSATLALGGGLKGGLAGAVSVLSMGTPIDAAAAKNVPPALVSEVNNDIQINDVRLNRKDNTGTANRANARLQGIKNPTISAALDPNLDVSTRRTAAFIADAGSATTKAQITSGGDITIDATHNTDVHVTTGQATAGAVALGAGIGIVRVSNDVDSFAGDFAQLSAARDIQITATDQQNPGTDGSDVSAFAGGLGGGFTVGGAIANFHVIANTNAHLGESANIRGANAVFIDAAHSDVTSTKGLGVVVGTGAAGATITETEVGGRVDAFVGDNAVIGGGGAVRSFTMGASSVSFAKSDSTGGKGGVVAGDFSDATTSVHPTAVSHLDTGANIDVDGDIRVVSKTSGDADATVHEVNVGGITLGLSQATTAMFPTASTITGAVTLRAGRNISLDAVHDGQEIKADAGAAAGAVAAATSTSTSAKSAANVLSLAGAGSNIIAGGSVFIRAASDNQATANTNGLALSVAGVGGPVSANATSSGSTTARLEGEVTAANLAVDAIGVNLVDAKAIAAGGGLFVDGLSDSATSTMTPTVNAAISPAALAAAVNGFLGTPGRPTGSTTNKIRIANNVLVRAESLTDADADARGTSGGTISVGDNTATITRNPTVGAIIGDVDVTAGGNVLVQANHEAPEAITNGLFDGVADVDTDSDVILLPGHRLQTGDSVSYESFNHANIGGLADENTYNVLRVSDTAIRLGSIFDAALIDAQKDTISFAGPHNLHTSDRVTYQASGNFAGEGLTPGTTYTVRVIDDHTIKLVDSIIIPLLRTFAASGVNNSSDTITLTQGFSADQAVTYRAPAGLQPIQGLVDGNTYYVIPVDANHFKLAATPGGAAIDISNAGTSGNHIIGVEGVDLAQGFGTHTLRLDLTATSTGNHVIRGAGGAASLLELSTGDDGIATALAKGASGSFAGVKGSTAKVGATLDTSAKLGDGANVTAGGDVVFSSTAFAEGTATADNLQGSVVFGLGTGTADVFMINNNSATIGANAVVNAGGDFRLLAQSTHNADIDADSGGIKSIAIARANGTASIRHHTTASVGDGARVTAGDVLQLSSTSDTIASATVNADGTGFGVNASANRDDDESGEAPRGVRIGRSDDRGTTSVDVGDNANLSARTVDVDAKVVHLKGKAMSKTNTKGLVTASNPVSRVEIFDDAMITVNPGARIRGEAKVDLRTDHADFRASSAANADALDLTGVATVKSINKADTKSTISTSAGAIITTHDLEADATTTVNQFSTKPTKDGFGIDLGDSATVKSDNAARLINFNAGVVLLSGPNPELIVNEAGLVVHVTPNVNVTFPTGAVSVGDIVNDDAGRIRLFVNSINGVNGTITGKSAFTFRETFEKVKLTNRSVKNLLLHKIDVVNRTDRPDVTLEAPTVSFQFDVLQSFEPTPVTIESNGLAPTDVQLAALIENPIGTTTIHGAGSIVNANSGALVRTNKLTLTADAGSIGSVSSPVRGELVQSPGRLPTLTASGGDDVNIDLKGRLRDPSVSTFNINTGTLIAGDTMALTLREGVRESSQPNSTYLVDVAQPTQSTNSTVRTHFPGSSSGTSLPLDVGVFGSSPANIGINYNFGLLQAVHTLDIVRTGANVAVGVQANTDLLQNGGMSVTTSGNINLRETNGNLLLRSITSTGGSVLLSAQGSITESTSDAAVDVAGNNITLVALAGSIGATGDTLEIDSAGAVNATSVTGVNLLETAGDLNIAAVSAPKGNVALESADGSILESGSDTLADVLGNAITLKAAQSHIGASSNDMEIDTGTGALTALAGQGIFLTEVSGGLNVQQSETAAGDVRLTVNDAASTGQNLTLLANGRITAAGAVTLQAGDNLDIPESGVVTAGNALTLRSDFQNLDPGVGSTMSVRGNVTGATQAFGNTDADSFTFADWKNSTQLNGAGGSDTLAVNFVGGSINALTSMQLIGDVTSASASTTARLDGSIDLGKAVHTFTVAEGSANPDLIVGAVMSGTGGLTKRGAGTLVLAGNNTYTGNTTLTEGTLQIDGVQSASKVVVTGGTLAGRGQIGTLSGNNFTLSPGSKIGNLSVNGDLTLASTDIYRVELNGTSPGKDFDSVSVRGAVNLGNAKLSVSLGFASSVKDTFVVVSKASAGPITGTFSGLTEGIILTLNNQKFQLTYKGGDGNDVALIHRDSNAAFVERSVNSPIDENGIATITGVPVDADPNDVFILLVNWGDGTPLERFEFAPQTPSVSVPHVYEDNGDFTIDLKWVDQHGGGNRDRLFVAVNNLAPTLALTGPTNGVRGQARAFTFMPQDPSPIDQASIFTYDIDWGDGTTESVAGPANFTRTHVYKDSKTFTVQATVRDKDGAISNLATQDINIAAVQMQDCDLAIGGASLDDLIIVEPADTNGTLKVTINGIDHGNFAPTGRLLIYGQDGADVILLKSAALGGQKTAVLAPAVLDGGAGDDVLSALGSSASNILLGRAGDDALIGGAGRDLMLGGAGIDALQSDANDLRFAVATTYDENPAALDAILEEWARTDITRTLRYQHLAGAIRGGLNAPFYLDLSLLQDMFGHR